LGRTVRIALIGALLAATVAVAMASGCGQQTQSRLQPKVSPPAIKEAGILRAGVDLEYPPFAGTDNGQEAGLDIDAASALADKLGLKVEFVDVKPSDAATALADGTADLVFSVPFSDSTLSDMSLAGSYVSDATGFFVATDSSASIEPTLTEKKLPLPPAKIGVQERSPAYRRLVSDLGADSVQTYPALRDAIRALDNGEVPVVAGDAMVAAYIARDFPNVHFAGQLGNGTLLGVGVKSDNTSLSDATRSALDGLAADGVLDTIRLKWVGDLAKLNVSASVSASQTSVPTTL
jgi:ABC-type amino acid transport substrate-binding protein